MKDFISSIGMVGCALILLVAAIFASGALYVVYLNTLGVAQMNAQRQVTTHSQQYVQTQQQVIINYYADWTKATDDAHRNAAVLQVCAQAAMLDAVEYPTQVAPFIAQNCR
jgi:archaellum component FlaF (FlaF/FlaG flagellin family)